MWVGSVSKILKCTVCLILKFGGGAGRKHNLSIRIGISEMKINELADLADRTTAIVAPWHMKSGWNMHFILCLTYGVCGIRYEIHCIEINQKKQ